MVQHVGHKRLHEVIHAQEALELLDVCRDGMSAMPQILAWSIFTPSAVKIHP